MRLPSRSWQCVAFSDHQLVYVYKLPRRAAAMPLDNTRQVTGMFDDSYENATYAQSETGRTDSKSDTIQTH